MPKATGNMETERDQFAGERGRNVGILAFNHMGSNLRQSMIDHVVVLC